VTIALSRGKMPEGIFVKVLHLTTRRRVASIHPTAEKSSLLRNWASGIKGFRKLDKHLLVG
jgi:hypothetical protein